MTTTEELRLLTGAQARAVDEATVAAGDSWDGLLARAGGALAREVAAVLREARGGVYGRRVTIAVGKGDNGGDGWVAASRLRELGAGVTVVAPLGVDVATSSHSARARAAYLAGGGRVTTDPLAVTELASRWWADHPVLVDCLLGTGARGAPRGVLAEVVEHLRFAGGSPSRPVVACDVPSGVDADTGTVAAEAVRAHVTVAFGASKPGLHVGAGRGHAGRVVVASLGGRWDRELRRLGRDLPPSAAWWLTSDCLAVPRPWPADADKRARGRVVLLAGSARFAGAGALTAAAAVRGGAGLVQLATSGPASAVHALEPGVMAASLPAADDGVGGPSAGAIEQVEELVSSADAVVIGPGLGHERATRAVVEAALAAVPTDAVVVLDADGLNVFREDAGALRDVAATLVLTPHERELARLLGRSPEDVVADRGAAARELAERADALVVAKGPGSLVVLPDGSIGVCRTGGPSLGTGGTGDVLAGLLGAAVASAGGTAADLAAAVAGAVHLHGLVGDEAGRRAAGRSTARDLLEVLPSVLVRLADDPGTPC